MPPNEEILDIQNELFRDEIRKENADGKEFVFVALNAPIFRLFTEDLSSDAKEAWEQYAHGDGGSLSELERFYDSFRQELIEYIKQHNSDEMQVLLEKVEEGNIDEASRIIETIGRKKHKSKEREHNERCEQ